MANTLLAMNNRRLHKRMTKEYSALIEWSDEDGCFVGSAYPLVGQCCHGAMRAEVAGKLEAIIDDLLNDPGWLKNVPEWSASKTSAEVDISTLR